MQLRLALHADNTAARLAVLAECTTDDRQWYLQNGIQLSPDVGIADRQYIEQLRAMSSAVSSVAVAGIDLPIADEMKVIGRLSAHI